MAPDYSRTRWKRETIDARGTDFPSVNIALRTKHSGVSLRLSLWRKFVRVGPRRASRPGGEVPKRELQRHRAVDAMPVACVNSCRWICNLYSGEKNGLAAATARP
jgi:hypothetical protein